MRTISVEEPLALLESWLADAREQGAPKPDSVAFVTVGEERQPTARTVSLKRVHGEALLFTSALWTRKARELQGNPRVALLFHWPTVGRQVHVAGLAELAERELGVELFAQRDLAHQLQTVLSRQGEQIERIEPLRERHAHLMQVTERPPACPDEWGAIRVLPQAMEFLDESPDRMHDRLLYERVAEQWRRKRLSP